MAVLRLGLGLLLALTLAGGKRCPAPTSKAPVKVRAFGAIASGEKADLYVLTNNRGMTVAITNYGATVVSIKVPDRAGKFADVVLGYDTAKEYEDGTAHFGGTVGRYANRIAHGSFVLAGKTYTLPKNNGENTLHGGLLSFDKKMWAGKEVPSKEGLAVEFTYTSPDGEEGFPGTMNVTVVFTLMNAKNELKIEYTASTDKPTVVNLTNHSYFDLAGQGNGDILSQTLQLNASKFTPVDSGLIPTGELRSVRGTPFDFLKPVAIGERINGEDEQLKLGRGYDHNWVLDRKTGFSGIEPAAVARDSKSGRVLEVLTTEPGIQFYTGNFLDGTAHGKEGKVYEQRYAFCLETQHFPDSPNHAGFPSTTLFPSKPYHSTTILRFSVR
ncbi:MAG TPA: aldose epimerase family protein [Candidatus Acidoferrum sp.]|nr:aldose epimerase family protein [Candidatus Acidoferrum sp.]